MSKRISTETVQYILDLYAKGAEINYICDATGVSEASVLRIRKKYGLVKRKEIMNIKDKKNPRGERLLRSMSWNEFNKTGRDLIETRKAVDDILAIIRI